MSYKERVIISLTDRIKDYVFAETDDDTMKLSHLAWAILPTDTTKKEPS